jgi:hypothetical protein
MILRNQTENLILFFPGGVMAVADGSFLRTENCLLKMCDL